VALFSGLVSILVAISKPCACRFGVQIEAVLKRWYHSTASTLNHTEKPIFDG